MSENGEPSNNRVMLFLFLTTIVCMVVASALVPAVWVGRTFVLPIIPPSFETFVEIIVGTLVGGSLLGKGVTAYKDVKGAPCGTDPVKPVGTDTSVPQ
jgi:hypothetical protein